ncbi:hypothetical protein [Nonomuraea sp. B5E05]|uniref:hypothetical protein n=1 Tax=Nonomuraea sp. B5E05 TaxID=3153569 RepID=UPI003260313D
MAANREIHVTSQCIARTRERLEQELRNEMIGFVRDLIPHTGLNGLGFGVIGDMFLAGTYDGVRKHADTMLGDAQATIDGWNEALTVCERNWRTAEDRSIIRYRS